MRISDWSSDVCSSDLRVCASVGPVCPGPAKGKSRKRVNDSSSFRGIMRKNSNFSGLMKKLLIANRGEIALRIMRSAKEMGINTVAVYSEADRRSPHVQFADEAICIGPPPANDSYLSVEKILEACRKTGADAVHPGYGFLSENAAFARALEQAGVIFVGPPPAAIEMMGNKLEAKETARSKGVPLVPGPKHAIRATAEALEIAREIGFPLQNGRAHV